MCAAQTEVAIIGGGPAGLAAAEVLVDAGVAVDLYDAMPSLGRKFLMAGKSGLNLTHAEPLNEFQTRFLPGDHQLHDMVEAFPPDAIRDWATRLGIETFVGSSGRVFPSEMKAAPLLRAWLRELRERGMNVHVRHRWTGWDDDHLVFETPSGSVETSYPNTILALGGASWPRLGSDAAWTSRLVERGVGLTPFAPSNCGFDVSWSDHLRNRFAGIPLKNVAVTIGDRTASGDTIITDTGLEGGPIYALSALIRDEITAQGSATIDIDLLPDLEVEQIVEKLGKPRGKMSLSNHLRKTLGVTGTKAAILFEDDHARNDPAPDWLGKRLKRLPLRLLRPRPIAEAISSAGGVTWSAVGDDLELIALPGTFVAGEMLDWDAPTGGYLLTGCLATGRRVGEGALRRLCQTRS